MNSMMPIVAPESDPISAFSPYIDRRTRLKRCDMQPLTGFAHALICQRVALPSFSVLAYGVVM